MMVVHNCPKLYMFTTHWSQDSSWRTLVSTLSRWKHLRVATDCGDAGADRQAAAHTGALPVQDTVYLGAAQAEQEELLGEVPSSVSRMDATPGIHFHNYGGVISS